MGLAEKLDTPLPPNYSYNSFIPGDLLTAGNEWAILRAKFSQWVKGASSTSQPIPISNPKRQFLL